MLRKRTASLTTPSHSTRSHAALPTAYDATSVSSDCDVAPNDDVGRSVCHAPPSAPGAASARWDTTACVQDQPDGLPAGASHATPSVRAVAEPTRRTLRTAPGLTAAVLQTIDAVKFDQPSIICVGPAAAECARSLNQYAVAGRRSCTTPVLPVAETERNGNAAAVAADDATLMSCKETAAPPLAQLSAMEVDVEVPHASAVGIVAGVCASAASASAKDKMQTTIRSIYFLISLFGDWIIRLSILMT